MGIYKKGNNYYIDYYGEKRPLKDIRTIFSRALRKAGIKDFRFHDFRHTFVSHLVMQGVDLKTIQELLRHKTFSMTLRYSHLSPSHKKEAVNVMDKVIKSLDGHYLDTGEKMRVLDISRKP